MTTAEHARVILALGVLNLTLVLAAVAVGGYGQAPPPPIAVVSPTPSSVPAGPTEEPTAQPTPAPSETPQSTPPPTATLATTDVPGSGPTPVVFVGMFLLAFVVVASRRSPRAIRPR